MDSDPTPFLPDAALLDALALSGIPVACIADRKLFGQGDECSGVFLLQRGRAHLEARSSSGKVVVRLAAGDGTLLGLADALSGGTYSLTAVASRGARVSFIDRDKFLDLLSTASTLSLKLVPVLAAELQAAHVALVRAMARRRFSQAD